MGNSQRGFIIPLLLIIVALLLVGGGTYLYTQTKLAAVSPATQATTNVASSIAQISEPPIIETTLYVSDYKETTGSELVFLSSSSPQDRIVIPANIVAKISSNGQFLTNGQLVINPANTKQVIFTTRTIDSNNPIATGDYSFINRIYSYDLDTNELKVLTTTEDKIVADRELIILGTQSSKVILLSHTSGKSVCGGMFWLDSPDRYTSLDMNNIGAGLQSYIVSAAKIKQEQSNEVGCPGN